MRIKKMILPIIVGAMFMSGCSNGEEFSSEDAAAGTLETEVFSLEYKDAEVIQSPMENTPGVYFTFDLTNESNENIVPNDILQNYLGASQTTDTSVVFLRSPYHTLDAFGDDNESYNEMLDKQSERHNELLPGKTVEVSYAFHLEDENIPIELRVYDLETDEEVGVYEVELD